MQDIFDSRHWFLFFSVEGASPTHDSVAFSVTDSSDIFERDEIPGGYWIAVDEAYAYSNTVITPVNCALAPAGSPENSFNFYLSSPLMHIEQAFGILVARWGILWRPLQFPLVQNVRIVQCAMLLHNYHKIREVCVVVLTGTRPAVTLLYEL